MKIDWTSKNQGLVELILMNSKRAVYLISTLTIAAVMGYSFLAKDIATPTSKQQIETALPTSELAGNENAEHLTEQSTVPFQILMTVDDATNVMLGPWVEEFHDSLKGEDKFEKYRLIQFDAETMLDIRGENVRIFAFNYGEDENYLIEIRRVQEKDDHWSFYGAIENNNRSTSQFSMFPDGQIWGEIHVPGYGRYLIRPTGQLPYHIAYLATGTYIID